MSPARRGSVRAALGTATVSSVALALACILHISACDDNVSHIFQGRLYAADRDCLGTPSVVDVVSGGDPGTCAPACIVKPDPDGGRTAYVSTMCAPYPPFMDASGADPFCAPALAALTRDDTCSADGGSSHPRPADAGSD